MNDQRDQGKIGDLLIGANCGGSCVGPTKPPSERLEHIKDCAQLLLALYGAGFLCHSITRPVTFGHNLKLVLYLVKAYSKLFLKATGPRAPAHHLVPHAQ